MTDTAALRESFRRDKAALLAELAGSGAQTRALQRSLRRLAQLVDGLLVQLWRQAGFAPELTLAAVGGFGRGELFPHSDVDVLVLLPDGTDPKQTPGLQQQLERFIGACWDCGL